MEKEHFNPAIQPDNLEDTTSIGIIGLEERKWYYWQDEMDNFYWGKLIDMVEDGYYVTLTLEIHAEFNYDSDEWVTLQKEITLYGPDMIDNLPLFYTADALLHKNNKHIPISNNTKYISKGSYGLTLRPALPNKKNNGSWEQFDNSVTKLFYNSRDRNTALAASAQVHEYTGNEGHIAKPYAYKYKKVIYPKH
jgi:hypothetical protein